MPQTALGELTALPTTPNWNKGDLLVREGKGCKEREDIGEGGGKRVRKETVGKGVEGTSYL